MRSDSYITLVKGWRQCVKNGAPFEFPGDELPAGACVEHESYEGFVSSSSLGNRHSSQLHTSLLPVPYIGNLEQADIFLLTLNPGLSPLDYYAEFKSSSFKQALICNLTQEGLDREFPFTGLNPQFAWHGGYNYWSGRLQRVIRLVEKSVGQGEYSYQRALSLVATRLAVLELVPYHSRRAPSSKLGTQLAATQAIKNYVHNNLVERAVKGEILLIVVRGWGQWGLVQHDQDIIYDQGAVRSGYLTEETSELIVERIQP